jgi:hypothetical protein
MMMLMMDESTKQTSLGLLRVYHSQFFYSFSMCVYLALPLSLIWLLLREETRREMETHLTLQEEQKKKELIEDLQLSSVVEEQAALLSSVDEDRERARAELARRVMEENRRVCFVPPTRIILLPLFDNHCFWMFS